MADVNRPFWTLLMLAGWLTTSHFGPWISWHSEWPFFAVAAAMAAALVWRRGSMREKWPAAAGAVVLLGGLALGQLAAGLISSHGQLAVVWLYVALALVGVAWGVAEPSRPGPPTEVPGEWLAWTLVVGATLLWFVMMAQVLVLWEGYPAIMRMPFETRPGGNLGQPNHAATLLVMALASTWYLWRAGRLGWLVGVALAWLFASGVAVTESRGGLLAVLVLVAWGGYRVFCLPRRWTNLSGLAAMAVLQVGLFLAWPHFFSAWRMSSVLPLSGAARLAESGSDARWTVWAQLWDASWLQPWTGWGIRNTAVAHNAVAHEGVFSLPLTYSHNLALDLVVWLGWPVGGLMVAGAAFWMLRQMVARHDTLGLFGMALVIPFAVHSLLEFPFAYAYLLLPAMVGVGYVERSGATLLRLPGLWVATALSGLFVLVVGTWSVVDYIRVEEDFRTARFQMLRIGPAPTEPPPRILLLDQLDEMVQSSRIDIRPDLSPQELDRLRRVALHNPWSGTQYRYAMALALTGARQEAERQLQVMQAQHGARVERPLRRQIDEALIKHGMPPLPARPPDLEGGLR